MARELKHVGRVKATGKKCIVAYRTLPGDAYNCLIVPTEGLPDSYHDAIINLVESASGQESYEFAEAMSRTGFPDGSIMLAALHTKGKLIKAPTDQIEMLPVPGVTILLSELNQIIAEQRGVAVDDLALKTDTKEDPKPDPVVQSNVAKTTSASVNEPETVQEVVENLTPDAQAKKYRSEADRLAKEAARFRRLADDIAPLPPQRRGRPTNESLKTVKES